MTSLQPPPDELLHDPNRLPPAPVGRAVLPARPGATRAQPPAAPPAAGFSNSDWDANPSVPNQLQIPDAFRPDRVEVLTLRTDSEPDMTRYSEILSNVRSNRARQAIIEHDRQFHNGTWLIFLVLQHFLFKRVLDLRKPSP